MTYEGGCLFLKTEIQDKILPMLGRILSILAILELYGTVLWYLMDLFQEPRKKNQINTLY